MKRKSPEASIFSCHNINVTLLWLILKWYTILEDFFLQDSIRYHNDVMTIWKFDWFNLKILMSGWYRKLTSLCVLFTTYQQCHNDAEGNITSTLLQYKNIRYGLINTRPEMWGEPFFSEKYNKFFQGEFLGLENRSWNIIKIFLEIIYGSFGLGAGKFHPWDKSKNLFWKSIINFSRV